MRLSSHESSPARLDIDSAGYSWLYYWFEGWRSATAVDFRNNAFCGAAPRPADQLILSYLSAQPIRLKQRSVSIEALTNHGVTKNEKFENQNEILLPTAPEWKDAEDFRLVVLHAVRPKPGFVARQILFQGPIPTLTVLRLIAEHSFGG